MMMNVSVMKAVQYVDDVDIARVKFFQGDLRAVYDYVKSCAVNFAGDYERISGEKCTVDIQENVEGLPSAYIYNHGKIEWIFFATNDGA